MTLWYLARAAGFVALLSATVTVALERSDPRPGRPVVLPRWPTFIGGCLPSWCTAPRR